MSLESFISEAKDVWGKISSPTIFTNPFGAQENLRYPLSDVEKYQNVIKFTALARTKKSSMLDVRAPATAEQPLGTVTLYMPTNITVNDTLSYDNVNTGLGGQMLNAAAGSSGPAEFIDQLKDNSKPIAQKMLSAKLGDMAGSKGMVGEAAGQALINLGEVVNPHTQMLFKGPGLRQFSFNFKLIPRSQSEANQIIKIVKFFRTCAYPELSSGGTGENGQSLQMAALKFPEIFRINYVNANGKDNPNMIKFIDSYLTSVGVTYNPNSPSFFDNGMPSEIDLQLTFQESKTLNRALIKKGY